MVEGRVVKYCKLSQGLLRLEVWRQKLRLLRLQAGREKDEDMRKSRLQDYAISLPGVSFNITLDFLGEHKAF